MRILPEAASAFAVLMLCASAFAQTTDRYPSRPVTIIVPVAPGAATENEGRIWSTKLGEQTNQQFIMDFKPGASGTLALAHVARQKPDGYTLSFVTSTYSILPLLFKDLPFDLVKSFDPISLLSKRVGLLVVSNNFPAKNLKEYVAYAKANPGKVNFATSGNGTILHLMGLWLSSATDTKVTYVHYKAAGAGYPDLMAGRVDIMPVTFSGGYPSMVKPGKVRALGTASLQRSAQLPDLPTIAEQGVPDYEYPSWLGLIAPVGTPPAVLRKLSTEISRATKSQEVRKRLGDDSIMVGSNPAEFREIVSRETARWRKLVVENDIKFD
jgi:tripartite-type tricarboxylate transporter receptor subunit TctC